MYDCKAIEATGWACRIAGLHFADDRRTVSVSVDASVAFCETVRSAGELTPGSKPGPGTSVFVPQLCYLHTTTHRAA